MYRFFYRSNKIWQLLQKKLYFEDVGMYKDFITSLQRGQLHFL